MNLLRLFSLFLLLVCSVSLILSKEDEVDSDADVDINDEDETSTIMSGGAGAPTDSETQSSDILQDKEEEEDPNRIPSSPEFHTMHIFVQPPSAKSELIAGKLTKMLVGARNNGTQNYVVETIEGSLRYPQDFTYYIQNFSISRVEKTVEPGLESTFDYTFLPSETFNARPMGFVLLVNYRNNEGKRFQNAVFNTTINFIDSDDGFDGETIFLYVFLVGLVVLLGVVAYQFLVSWRPKRGVGLLSGSKKQSDNLQSGQQGDRKNYDIDWIPKHHLVQNKKSPRPRKSRQGGADSNGAASGAGGAASSENDE